MNGAEAMVRMLEIHGVRHIFGLCGDTTLPFYDALYRLDHEMEHILTRDERSAAYMADGYARVTGKVGVCEGPSGGGATYILPGLVEANESSVSILAITSDVSVKARGHYPLTELDQEGLMRPLTKWNTIINRSDMLPDVVRTAFRKMTTGRPGSAHLGLPIDVQRDEVDPNAVWADPNHGFFPAYPVGPDMIEIEKALEAIQSASFPAVIVGGGIVLAGGEAEFQDFVESLDIAVATTISGQGTIPETHPNCVGVVGSNGGVPATRDLVKKADLIVFIGCRAGSVTTELWRYPAKTTRIVHIDSDQRGYLRILRHRSRSGLRCSPGFIGHEQTFSPQPTHWHRLWWRRGRGRSEKDQMGRLQHPGCQRRQPYQTRTHRGHTSKNP